MELSTTILGNLDTGYDGAESSGTKATRGRFWEMKTNPNDTNWTQNRIIGRGGQNRSTTAGEATKALAWAGRWIAR